MTPSDEEPTERGDRIAAEMREYYEANKHARWNEACADNLMLGLLNIAWKHIAPRTGQEMIDTRPGFAERVGYERRILALEVALEQARKWVQAALDDKDTGTQPGNACFNALQEIDSALAVVPSQVEGQVRELREALERIAALTDEQIEDGWEPRAIAHNALAKLTGEVKP